MAVKISIITAVLNNKDFFEASIGSIHSQTLPVEHIVIDGGSTDGTREIIQRNEDKISRWLSEPDEGIYDALNKGIKMATGDIVGFLHAGDLYAHDRVIETVADHMERHAVNSCYGDLLYVDRVNTERIFRKWKSGNYDKKKFYGGWMPPHPTFFVRRNLYEQYGLFNLSMGTAADYELMLRLLLRHGITTTYIPEVLIKMRTGGVSNASFKNRLRANRMDRMAWQLNNLNPYPWTIYFKPLRKLLQFLFK